uniref:Uncharacterized protein n=1 Tax=Saimiri boliviensis boliviensis TaxID=39432 RepID=A0A2K6V6W8_SAIBB
PGSGGCAHGAQCHGLHWGRNRCVLHSSQYDVRSSHGQRGWDFCGEPGGYSAVSGGSWTLHIIQRLPGHWWVSDGGLLGGKEMKQ